MKKVRGRDLYYLIRLSNLSSNGKGLNNLNKKKVGLIYNPSTCHSIGNEFVKRSNNLMYMVLLTGTF